MGDSYEADYNNSSETYEEDDSMSGGEQIASAMYVNEELDERDEIIDNKQNTVVLQPLDPPVNPAHGDMWIDTNRFPNIIYAWDSVEAAWKRTSAIAASEVGAYSTVQVDDSLRNINMDIDAVSSAVTTATETLADGEGLATRITETDTYRLDREIAIANGLNEFVESLQDENTANDRLPLFVTSSALEQRAAEILAAFTSSGGVNMLKNSVGYAVDESLGLLHWQVISGAISQYISADCVDAGAGIYIEDGVIKQAVSSTAGQPYTLTLLVKKGTAGSAYVKLSDGTVFQQLDLIATQQYDYTQIQISGFIPETNVLIVELGAVGATGGAIFTAIMLNAGTAGLQWSHANGESYNGSTSLDVNGIKVKSNAYDGYTVMSPSEFSGYYRNGQGVMQKVFTLNKEVTEVAKLAVTDVAGEAEIRMGTVRALYVDGNGHRGWAFIPSS